MALSLIIIGIILIIIEIFTVSTLFIWIGAGFIAAGMTYLIIPNIFLSFAVGIIVAIVLVGIFFTRYTNFLKVKTTNTSYQTIINESCLVTKEIDGINKIKGTIKINDQTWNAMIDEPIVVEIGTNVEIVEIKGATVYIKVQ